MLPFNSFLNAIYKIPSIEIFLFLMALQQSGEMLAAYCESESSFLSS